MIDLRRWPLFLPLLAAVMGLALARTDLVSISVAVIVLIVFPSLLYVFKQRMLAALMLLGALWGGADLLLDANRLTVDDTWLGITMTVTARVEKVELLTSSQRYLLQHIRRDDGVSIPGKALLYRYRASAKATAKSTIGATVGAEPIQAGQVIRFQVRWRLPRNYKNPGAFDYRAWCFDRHIALIGSMRGKPKLMDGSVSWLEQQRQKLRRAMTRLPASDDGVLQALLLADRTQVSDQANRVFAATGAAHLLAISGMHIGMVAAWTFALLWFALTRREVWIVYLPVRSIALSGGFLAAVAYGSIAGWPLPAMRAALMLGAAVLAWCWSSRSEPINTLLAALGLILVVDPSAIASLSLWLSFVATASLLMWAAQLRPEESLAWHQRLLFAGHSLLWMSLLAALATLPLIVANFGRIPVYTLLANIIMVPLYAFFIMPATLLGAICALFALHSWAAALMSMASAGVHWGVVWLSLLAGLPAGEMWAVHPSTALALFYAVGMLLGGCLVWRKHRLKAAALVSLVLAVYLFCALHERDVRQAQWIVWDVGQGAASTLLLPHKQVIVVDAPGHAGSRFNGGTTVAAGLRALALSHVDVLVLTHAQSDHLGGALSLLRSVNTVGEIWLPDVPDAHDDKRVRRIVSYAAEHNIVVRWMAIGDGKQWNDVSGGGVLMQVLWPPRGHDPGNANNTSLVLRVDFNDDANDDVSGNVGMLWPGDIEIEAERSLMQAGLKPVDMMLMPHHGSRSSSHAAFIQGLQPKLAVAQTGVGNRYGFPAKAVVQSYQELGARVYNTASGAILITVGDQPDAGGDLLQWARKAGTRRDVAQAWWQSFRH